MTGIVYAFLGTLFTFLITTAGAVNVFLIRREIAQDVQCLFLGFAGGVMTAASIWSLLLPGITMAQEKQQLGWLVISGGFLAGVLLLLLVDKGIKKQYEKRQLSGAQAALSQKSTLFVLAVTIHNVPEGMAVGLAFALAAQNIGDANAMSGAVALALGVGIQNYPEGMAVVLPLMKEGIRARRAFGIGMLSAAAEPLAAVLAAALAGVVLSVMPALLAFAAGTMIYVVVEELIPEAHLGERKSIGTLGFAAGFLVMMILDVTLG